MRNCCLAIVDERWRGAIDRVDRSLAGRLEALKNLGMLLGGGVQAGEVHYAGCGGGSAWGHDGALRLC